MRMGRAVARICPSGYQSLEATQADAKLAFDGSLATAHHFRLINRFARVSIGYRYRRCWRV